MRNRKNSSSGIKVSGFKIILIIIVSFILIGIGYCGFQVYTLSNRQEQMKKDYMVINSVSFGLLSVDEWRDNIVAAVKAQIKDFKLTPQQNRDLKKDIEQILHSLIDKAVASMEQPTKTLGGKITKLAFKTFVKTKDLHDSVPAYSQKIINEINKPSSYRKLKNIALEELDSLGTKTYDSSKNAENSIDGFYFQEIQWRNRQTLI